MEKRQSDERFLCADLVSLEWLTGEGALRTEQALLEDISHLGGCVQLDQPVSPGSVVMLTVGNTPFYGHVCYCTLRDQGYFIGLRFSNDTTWSAGAVTPQHLTSLLKLSEKAPEKRPGSAKPV